MLCDLEQDTVAMSQTPYVIEFEHQYPVVVLLPRLNSVPWTEFEHVGNQLLKDIEGQVRRDFMIDLSKLDYISSGIVAFLVRIWKRVGEKDGRMVVICQHADVLEVLEIAGLTGVWTIVESPERAARVLRGTPMQRVVKWASFLLPTIGFVALLAALVGLLFLFRPSESFQAAQALSLAVWCAAITVLTGTVSVLYEKRAWRFLGACLVIAGMGSLVGGMFIVQRSFSG